MFRALFEIPRPLNCAITFFSVLLGGWLGNATVTTDLLLAALSAALISGGGNVLNDLCGLTEDRINKPQRPLPSGRLSMQIASLLTGLLLILGLIFGLFLLWPAPLIAFSAVFLLTVYNLYLKRVPFLGNLTVSLLGGLAFLYGGFAVHTPQAAIWPALFSALFHLGREILKDLEDCAGDRLLQGSTIPLRWGQTVAQVLITFIFLLLIALTPLPAIWDTCGAIYLSLVALLDLSLIYMLIRLWHSPRLQTLHHLSHLLKAGMLLGLCAFFFDRI